MRISSTLKWKLIFVRFYAFQAKSNVWERRTKNFPLPLIDYETLDLLQMNNFDMMLWITLTFFLKFPFVNAQFLFFNSSFSTQFKGCRKKFQHLSWESLILYFWWKKNTFCQANQINSEWGNITKVSMEKKSKFLSFKSKEINFCILAASLKVKLSSWKPELLNNFSCQSFE